MSKEKLQLGLGEFTLDDDDDLAGVLADSDDAGIEVTDDEQEALNEIAKRIHRALKENESLRPSSWNEVLNGIKILLHYRQEISKGKRGKGKVKLSQLEEAIDEFAKVLNEAL